MNLGKNAVLYLVFSLLAAALLSILTMLAPEQNPTPSSQYIVFAAFTASCLLGVMMTLKPGLLRRSQTKTLKKQAAGHVRPFRGHHPDCSVFQTHMIKAQDRTLCAGCLGLATGMIIAICLMVSALLAPGFLVPNLTWLLLGFLMIFGVFLESIRNHRSPHLHFSINSLLAPGYALITLSILQQTGELMFGLFALLLCFLWTDTRIQLAAWRHHTRCTTCSEPCKSYPRPD